MGRIKKTIDINTYEDIIVTSKGDLVVDGEVYEQGGYMSISSGDSSSHIVY